ncbi:MAG: hypothetical protein MOGMAGMI_01695 [Candidatus Omnitrophica bacterium]|nr:hypothetical protein [Candidatus Omnitrophota bacterium]
MKGDGLSGAAYLVPLTVSLALNGAALLAVDGVIRREAADVERLSIARREAEDSLKFEFVEAPPKTQPRSPRRTRKVSDRDALNQDQSARTGVRPEARPALPEGPADQLTQSLGDGSVPAPPVSPSVHSPQAEPVERSPSTEPEERKVTPPDAHGLVPAEPTTAGQPAVELRESSAAPPSPQQAPQSPQAGTPGTDKIIQSGMSRRPSSGATLYGATSFEATGSGMGEYMKRLKEKIWAAWFPYIAFKYPQDFRGADAVIAMTLDRQGRVRIVRIVESQGSELFAQFCTEAVQRAGDFGALPEEILTLLGKEELEILFAFHYR